MVVHRIVLARQLLEAVQAGSISCVLTPALVAAPGDVLLAGLADQLPLVRLKVTGLRRQVPFRELTRRELQRAGLREPQRRAEALAELGGGANPAVNVVHVRLMKRASQP